jgi:GH15 family glucan-1,4-alpha-glucosidase
LCDSRHETPDWSRERGVSGTVTTTGVAAVYKPIEDYGIIGDLRSVGLVATDGSLDFLCFPHFDSPSIFVALLGDENGAPFESAPISNRCGASSSTCLTRTF